MGANAERHGFLSGIDDGEAGGKAILQQTVTDTQSKREWILPQRVRTFPQFKFHKVLSLSNYGKFTFARKAVAVHLIFSAVDSNFAIL